MQTRIVKSVSIGGDICPLSDGENLALYNGQWREIQEDQDGENYIHAGDGVIYLDKLPQPQDEAPAIPVKDELLKVFAFKGQIVSSDTGDLIAEVYPYREGAKELAVKIADAVNETYGRGYDPTKVDELYKALEASRNFIVDNLYRLTGTDDVRMQSLKALVDAKPERR